MLAGFQRSLQAARSFEAVQDAVAAAFPGLERARDLDRSEIAELATLYTGGTPLSLALQTRRSRGLTLTRPNQTASCRALAPLFPRGAETG